MAYTTEEVVLCVALVGMACLASSWLLSACGKKPSLEYVARAASPVPDLWLSREEDHHYRILEQTVGHQQARESMLRHRGGPLPTGNIVTDRKAAADYEEAMRMREEKEEDEKEQRFAIANQLPHADLTKRALIERVEQKKEQLAKMRKERKAKKEKKEKEKPAGANEKGPALPRAAHGFQQDLLDEMEKMLDDL